MPYRTFPLHLVWAACVCRDSYECQVPSVRLMEESNKQARRCFRWCPLFSRDLKNHLRTIQLCYLGRNANFRRESGRFCTERSINSKTITCNAVSALIQLAVHKSVRKPSAELGIPFWIVFDHMKKELAVWSFLPLSVNELSGADMRRGQKAFALLLERLPAAVSREEFPFTQECVIYHNSIPFSQNVEFTCTLYPSV